jgi:hypothetical protein
MMRIVRAFACFTLLGITAPFVAHAQEPSGIVSYIAFTDPGTNERWIPKTADGAVIGYPVAIVVIFRSKTDGRESRVRVENPGPTVVFADAAKYEITFTHSDYADPPILLGRSAGSSGPRQVQFHYDRWRFDRVEIEPWRLFSGGRETRVPLNRRGSPFPDLR